MQRRPCSSGIPYDRSTRRWAHRRSISPSVPLRSLYSTRSSPRTRTALVGRPLRRGAELGRRRDGMPIAAEQVAHRRAGHDAGEPFILSGAQHVVPPASLTGWRHSTRSTREGQRVSAASRGVSPAPVDAVDVNGRIDVIALDPLARMIEQAGLVSGGWVLGAGRRVEPANGALNFSAGSRYSDWIAPHRVTMTHWSHRRSSRVASPSSMGPRTNGLPSCRSSWRYNHQRLHGGIGGTTLASPR